MKRGFLPLVMPFLLTITLSACESQTENMEAAPSPSSLSDRSGHWELVCEDYRPVSYDLCTAISFPMFEGKTREEWENYSISIGKIDNAFITWAVGGRLSADGRYLAYLSNKDCLEVNNAMSVFLMDMYSGRERVLLSGKDGQYFRAIAWLDDKTLFCSATVYNGTKDSPDDEYMICDLEGETIPLALGEFTGPFPFAMQGRTLACLTGPEGKSIRLVRIEEDGSVTEIAQQEFDGYPINGGGVSPDGKWVAFPLRSDMEGSGRGVCLWSPENGTVVLLENPTPKEGGDPAAITVRWENVYPEVDFNIANAPDSNGHNELWGYIF